MTLQFDHLGVNVHDLERVSRFFADLGFDCDGPWELRGEWLDRLIGLHDARADMVNASIPGGSGSLELLAFRGPGPEEDAGTHAVDAPGYRHVAFRVDDIRRYASLAQAAGGSPVGEVVEVGGALRMHVAGPESLFVEFIQPLPASD